MTDASHNKPLTSFGEALVREVRDQTITRWDMISAGKMKGPYAVKVSEEIAKLSPEAKEVLAKLIPEIVDSTLHNMMFMLEQHEDIRVAADAGGAQEPDLARASDGLAGELVGWIPQFTQQRHKTFG